MPIATNSEIFDLSTENKTEKFAYKISKKIKFGDIIFLYGEMGVGKTTFVKYFINGLQKKYKKKLTLVNSPTFNLLNEYLIKDIKVNHYDLFRLKSSNEIKNLDLFENKETSITIVEWPQIIKKKPKNLIELNFVYGKNYEKRTVEVKGLNL